MSNEKCSICGVKMNDKHDLTTEDCGGDCLKCMAEEVGDSDCLTAMRLIDQMELKKIKKENEELKIKLSEKKEMEGSYSVYYSQKKNEFAFVYEQHENDVVRFKTDFNDDIFEQGYARMNWSDFFRCYKRIGELIRT